MSIRTIRPLTLLALVACAILPAACGSSDQGTTTTATQQSYQPAPMAEQSSTVTRMR